LIGCKSSRFWITRSKCSDLALLRSMFPEKCLLDENLPRRLARYFSNEITVISIHDTPFRSMKNGELLRAMIKANFACLITADQNLSYQQNLDSFELSIIVIQTRDTRLPHLIARFEIIQRAISRCTPNSLVHANLISS
jgi:predicted nuclease of predicted toxin-antitoxin system